MGVEVNSSSRLLFADLLKSDGYEFWDTIVLPDSRPRPDDIQHIVAGADRIDLLAYRYYGDSRFWWVIAWANDFEILPTDMKENDQIRIPSKDFVDRVLLRGVRRKS